MSCPSRPGADAECNRLILQPADHVFLSRRFGTIGARRGKGMMALTGPTALQALIIFVHNLPDLHTSRCIAINMDA